MTVFMYKLPYPPSVNAIYKKINGKISKRTGKRSTHALDDRVVAYRWDVVAAIGKDHQKLIGPLKVEIYAYMPDRRTRDLDNLGKCILDAMTHCGVWSDDSQIDDLRIIRCNVEKKGRILLNVVQLQEDL